MRFRSEAEAKPWLDGVAASYLFPSLIFYIGSKPSALLVTREWVESFEGVTTEIFGESAIYYITSENLE
jgi:hypothetical protein